MLKTKSKGRPRGSKNKPKLPGFYKLSPEQILAHFGDSPYILVSKDWLFKSLGDNQLFDTFFSASPAPTPEPKWKIQEL